jgi:hypothetical protein
MRNKDDISIAENLWIDWIEFDYKNSNPKDIDEFLAPTLNFWIGLEVHCVAGCCGLDAFSFWKEDIINSAKNFNQNSFLDELKTLKEKIYNLEKDELMSSRMNNLFHKNVFLKLLDHISEQIKN